MADNTIRLQKYLSECGVASRRKAEEMIAAGKVKVNGKPATIGDKINPKQDTVVVAGKKIRKSKKNTYIMLHKPRGFITTLNDEMGRKCYGGDFCECCRLGGFFTYFCVLVYIRGCLRRAAATGTTYGQKCCAE